MLFFFNGKKFEILGELSAESASHLENYAIAMVSLLEQLNNHTASELTKNVYYYHLTYKFERKRRCIHC